MCTREKEGCVPEARRCIHLVLLFFDFTGPIASICTCALGKPLCVGLLVQYWLYNLLGHHKLQPSFCRAQLLCHPPLTTCTCVCVVCTGVRGVQAAQRDILPGYRSP